MTFGTALEYKELLKEDVDIYDIREELAIASLTSYFPNFPLLEEMAELPEDIQRKIRYSIYMQIYYEKDLSLYTSNGTNIANATIGDFVYSKGMTYVGKGSTGVSRYSSKAIDILKGTRLFSNNISKIYT